MRPTLLLALLAGVPAAPPAPDELTPDEKIVHLLNRFTPGATEALVAEVKAAGWREWLEAQLKGDAPETEKVKALLAKLETIGLSARDIAENYDPKPPKGATEQEKREARRKAAQPLQELAVWVLARALHSSQPVRETACDFFRNHFSISIEKGEVRFLVTEWEREVIHKRALGTFGDLLEATATHPAMLVYLDNHLSRRPPSPEELKSLEARVKRRTGSEERAEEAVDLAKQRGLNENYARELLELHTLGVDNFYTQKDVIEVAKCLTGWTIRRGGDRKLSYEFNVFMHAGGDKTFLDGVIEEDKRGPGEGKKVLEMLKTHEGTARFLSWKLCRWLVNDDPDPAMVKRIADVFRATGGDLPKVLLAIADDPGFFTRANFRGKYKRPWEYVTSALRATGADVTDPRGVMQALNEMNESVYRCADPTGYYDQAEAWRDPGAMAVRWAFAQNLAEGRVGGARIPPDFYKPLEGAQPSQVRGILAAKLLPVSGAGEATAAAIDALVKGELQKNPKLTARQLGPRVAAMLLGSPEFQKQ